MNNIEITSSNSEILLYQTEDGKSRIQVRLDGETVWLSQKLMAELFQTSISNINQHIKNIFDEKELSSEAVIKYYLITASDGKNYQTQFYNLDVILAVGYRVRSHCGTQFRQWATECLKEFLVKGFILDDERLKEGRSLGQDYFDELLERIRDIRASEKRFYQKIRDIYKLSIDYDPNADGTRQFFQIVQNKLHFAISGKTAAEIIAERADACKPNMGLTSFGGSKVRRKDVTVAKNYLSHEEISQLNRIIAMYLDYAEDQAKRRNPLYMKDWREKLDAFLQFNERQILQNAGRIQMEVAKKLALNEYEKFNSLRLAQESLEEEAFDEAARMLENRKK